LDHRVASAPAIPAPCHDVATMATPNNLGRSSLLDSHTPPQRQPTHVFERRWSNMALNNPCFKQGIGIALAVALIGGPLFALMDIPDDPGLPLLDFIMVLSTIVFCFELVVNLCASPAYRCSFFCLMDFFGTLSMAFEISFLLGSSDAIHAVLLRSARAAKLGARAGRIFKLVMCYSLLIKEGGLDSEKPRFEAKVLAQRLTTSIATRVAMLTIFLVMLLPLLELPVFPRADQSMDLWARNLEEAYATSNETKFSIEVSTMSSFYLSSDYAPYALEGFNYTLLTSVQQPARSQNRVIIEVSECLVLRDGCDNSSKAKVLFNFTGAHQIAALMEIALVIVIVAIMIGMTQDLGSVLTMMMVRPLEKMFSGLMTSAQSLMDICASVDDEEEDNEETRATELETIASWMTIMKATKEKTLEKLSRIAAQALNKNVISKEEMATKSEYEKAVLVEMLQTEVTGETMTPALLEIRRSMGKEKQDLELRLQSWDFDTLSLDPAGMESMTTHIFFDSEFGIAKMFCEDSAFKAFYDAVKPNYQDVPYHCFAHACDVLHTVFRFCGLSFGRFWMREVEQYSLLIAALCHDMGHFGKTNPFLVESGHPLAITYNDKSPLENMRCAKLFEICNDPTANAFGKASKDIYKEARKVVVAAILHTDNANHFAMIKDISQAFEAQELCCGKQAGETGGLLKEYRDKILEPHRLPWLELFLHLADVSNPLKPFNLSHAWAMRVLEEFFLQGDEEKQQGLPVGMLNDREKVNKADSQHGFITFLVSPLVVPAINLFPQFTDLHVQMVVNLEKWRDQWILDVKPSEEAIAKKEESLAKSREMTERLLARRRPRERMAPPARSSQWPFRDKDTE
ncbi:unnamed protein product, partial [Durusdinium trenchii]